MIYGHAVDSPDTMWLDRFSPEQADDPYPLGAMGAVCVRHSERLSPPRGWTMDDRRVAVPPLFKVVTSSSSVAPSTSSAPAKRPSADAKKSSSGASSGTSSGSAAKDPTAPTPKPRAPRKDRTTEIPRPSLFGDLQADPVRESVVEPVAEPVVEPVVVPVVEPVKERVVEPSRPVVDDSTELEIQQDIVHRSRPDDDSDRDLTGDATRPWIPTFDPDDDLNGMLDATTPMLRDAFRSRHNGRVDRDAP